MIRSIMVPLDGSRFAEVALRVARALARCAHAKLRLVLVRPAAGTGGPGDAELRYLEEAGSRLAGTGATVEYCVQEGSVVDCLRRDLEETDVDLVVMATRARGSLPPPQAGSVAAALVRQSPASVLLVGQGGADESLVDQASHPRSVLAPVDLAQEHSLVPGALVDYACATQAHITLLSVVPPGEAPPPPPPGAAPRRERKPEERRWRAQRGLDRLADQLRARGLRTAARVVVGRSVPEAILEQLAKGPADMVAISPRPLTGETPSGVEGVTEAVVRGATKPVLVLPRVRPYGPKTTPASP